MTYLSILLIINLAIIAFAILCLVKKYTGSYHRDIVKHFGMLELSWSILCFLLAMSTTFSVLEASEKGSSFLEIAGGVNVVILAILFGFGTVHLFFSGIIFFRISKNESL